MYPGFTDPPGYVTEARCGPDTSRRFARSARNKQAKHDLTWDEMVDNGYVVIGGPDTVREQLEEAASELRIGHLCAMLQFGNMNDELTRYNTKLFGEKVAPGLADPVLASTRSVVAAKCPITRLIYLFGIAGHAELSPAMRLVEQDGWEIVVPTVARLRWCGGFRAARRVPRLARRCSGTRSTRPARRRARSSAPRSVE